MRPQLGGNSFNSVPISVLSNVQLSSDAPEVQLWHSCGLARMLADAHMQRSDTFQDCGEYQDCPHRLQYLSLVFLKRTGNAILNLAVIPFNSVSIAVQGAVIFRCSGRAAVDLLECWQMRPSKDHTFQDCGVRTDCPTTATIPESGISEAYRKRAILNSVVIPSAPQFLSFPRWCYFQMLRGGQLRRTCELARLFPDAPKQSNSMSEVHGPRLSRYSYPYSSGIVKRKCDAHGGRMFARASQLLSSPSWCYSDAPDDQLWRPCGLSRLFRFG